MIFDTNIILESPEVVIRPLVQTDTDALYKIATDPDIWTWFTVILSTREDVETWVNEALAYREKKLGIRLSSSINQTKNLLVQQVSETSQKKTGGWRLVGPGLVKNSIIPASINRLSFFY